MPAKTNLLFIEERNGIFNYDHNTRERIATGQVCRCGRCSCCETLRQAREHGDEVLKKLNKTLDDI